MRYCIFTEGQVTQQLGKTINKQWLFSRLFWGSYWICSSIQSGCDTTCLKKTCFGPFSPFLHELTIYTGPLVSATFQDEKDEEDEEDEKDEEDEEALWVLTISFMIINLMPYVWKL